MKGYYKHQDKTEKIIINGWLHTGDIGRVDDEGYLYIEGEDLTLYKYLDIHVFFKETSINWAKLI